MTGRPRIHLNLHLPELSPTQADFLWQVLSDLTDALWDAYADDLLEVEQQRQHLLDMEEEWADSEEAAEDYAPTSPNTNQQEPDPDF